MGLIFGRKKRRKRAAYDPDEFVDTRPNPLLTRGFSKGGSSQGYGNEGGLYANNENWDDSPRDSWDNGWVAATTADETKGLSLCLMPASPTGDARVHRPPQRGTARGHLA